MRAVSRDNLKRYLPLKGYWDSDRSDANNRAYLSNDLKTLTARGIVGVSREWIWLK